MTGPKRDAENGPERDIDPAIFNAAARDVADEAVRRLQTDPVTKPATWRQRLVARFYADEHDATLRVGGVVIILFTLLVVAGVGALVIVLLHVALGMPR